VILAVSDVSGGRSVPGGIDVPSLLTAMKPGVLLKELSIGDAITNDGLFWPSTVTY
jgi:hypothetical protein